MANDLTIPAGYDGREQALVKHLLLKSYLEKLFHIIGMTKVKGSTELCYVDCFAGPWGASTESMDTTSIGVSLGVLARCRQTLESRGISTTIRALYIEQDASAFRRLEEYLTGHTPPRIVAEALHGDFVQLRSEILRWVGPNAFAFFFVDPKGWKEVGIQVLSPLLQRPKSEFLINFMYDFVNRTMSMASWKQQMTSLVGESIDLDGLDPEDRESKIVATFRSHLKREMPNPIDSRFRARAAHVRVMDPVKRRPKYHLVYLTSHPKGVIEFMGVSEDVDLVQRVVRAHKRVSKREQRSLTADLFGVDSLVNEFEGHVPGTVVDEYWVKYLATGPTLIAQSEFADILESTGWFPGDLQASLARLIDRKRVVNLDATARRPKKPLHFEGKGERLSLAPSL